MSSSATATAAAAVADHQHQHQHQHPHKRRSSTVAAPPANSGRGSDDGGDGDNGDNGHKGHASSAPSAAAHENTYLIGPRAHAEAAGSPAAAQALGVAPFDAAAARRALGAAIRERVAASAGGGAAYDPLAAAQMARRLAEDARQRLRALGYGRYKLVVQAVVGQRAGQAVRCASRCLWGDGDGWASESYEGDAIYCVVQVHALYHE